ncbi:Hypothetical protein D9617_16g015250 [Elsinoe fawcettii]|nr:Hypothetical protein D9617_16g015250 [Elsinoe fawcettii]
MSATPVNRTVFQAFEWHTPGSHWTRLRECLPQLANIGITSIWLPPGCKANSPEGNGYDCYDLWDLGEFDQKWTRATKWGSKEELLALMSSARGLNISIIWDAVLNHKTAGDATEPCWAVEVDPLDRRVETSRPKQIEPWIHYNFPGRGGTYSSLKWHWQHFNGTDWDQRGQQHALFKIVNPPTAADNKRKSGSRREKDWALDVDNEHGNADYLMFSNIDYTNQEVREDVLNWGEWMVNEVGDGVDGFRLDAVQHYSRAFTLEWIERVQACGRQKGKDILVAGEFWQLDCGKLISWVDAMKGKAMVFDVPLLNKFAQMKRPTQHSKWNQWRRPARPGFDIRRIFEGTVVEHRPNNAMTVVANHDTQRGQAMDTPIELLFTTHAYALILLSARGTPCVFYGDLYGTLGPDSCGPSCQGKLPSLIMARKLYAYGEEQLAFFGSKVMTFVRKGTHDRPDGCVVIMSIGYGAKAKLPVGSAKVGEVWTDVLCNSPHEVTIDGGGFGEFNCPAESCCVFVRRDAEGRDMFPPPLAMMNYH